jgi:hypothetical protein
MDEAAHSQKRTSTMLWDEGNDGSKIFFQGFFGLGGPN